MWFGKAVDDFNATIEAQGESGPQLAASTGNAFTSTFSFRLSLLDSFTDFKLSRSGLGRICFLCSATHRLPCEAQRESFQVKLELRAFLLALALLSNTHITRTYGFLHTCTSGLIHYLHLHPIIFILDLSTSVPYTS